MLQFYEMKRFCLMAFFALTMLISATAHSAVATPTYLHLAWYQDVDSLNTTMEALATDRIGNTYVVGNFSLEQDKPDDTKSDVILWKYGSGGKELWKRQFGSNEDYMASSVVTDTGGNIYVVGETYGTLPSQKNSGESDIFVRKYSPDGVELWTDQFGTEDYDSVYSAAVDESGNIYVVGDTYGTLPGQKSLGERDAFIRKYSRDGVELWTDQFGTDSYDRAYSIALDKKGNMYVGGRTIGDFFDNGILGILEVFAYKYRDRTYNPDDGIDAFIRKYSPGGKALWTRQFGGRKHSTNIKSVAVDDSGNVYVVGEIDDVLPGQNNSGESDVFIRKYNPNGMDLWTDQFGTKGYDTIRSVVLDKKGNICVTGNIRGSLTGQKKSNELNTFVQKYKPNGTVFWMQQFEIELIQGVAMGKDDALYLLARNFLSKWVP